jgi:hypothetical protein
MNLSLVAELEANFETSRLFPTLVRGDGIAEIKEAARRCGLNDANIRVIGPQEFSMPAIWEAQSKNLWFFVKYCGSPREVAMMGCEA